MTGLIEQAILVYMKHVGIAELKDRLSYYLRLVKRGETVEVLERNVPVARISGVAGGAMKEQNLLRRLQRDGVICSPAARPYKRFLKSPAPACTADAVQVLIEDRGDR